MSFSSYEKKEFRLEARAISLPLRLEDIYEHTGLIEFKGDVLHYKSLSEDEVEWARFLACECVAYIDWCDDSLVKIEAVLKRIEREDRSLLKPKTIKQSDRVVDFLLHQKTCAAFLLERCHFALHFNKQSSVTTNEAALTVLTDEKEALKKRVAELENAAQNDAKDEEIGRLKMHLDEAERVRDGLSSELAVKTLELEAVRQDLKALQTVPGENPSLPTNIKTVLRMLQEQKTDREIAQALYNGGGNSGMSQAQVKALLWRGDEFPAEQSIKNAMKELFLTAGKSTL